jgi:RNA polymerase sigma factor (sigma-70 family)
MCPFRPLPGDRSSRPSLTAGGGVQTAPGGGFPPPLALFNAHQRNATLAARRLPRCVRRDEVEAAALAGLWRAALAYDPGRGVLFRTYAAWRVRGEVLELLREQVLAGPRRGGACCRRRPLPEGLPARPDPRPALADAADRLAPLRRLLPWRVRVLLRLIYDEGMTQAAAAAILGLAASHLSNEHARALAVMRAGAGAGGMTHRPGL